MKLVSETLSIPVIGAVIIGRNEGIRLIRCLRSVQLNKMKVVYVDSGSSDDSVNTAKSFGADVLSLDLSIPFCAARARNAGFEFLVSKYPALTFIQFIDGDSEILNNWVELAVKALMHDKEIAIVAGTVKEYAPNLSIYNQLGNLEWNSQGTGEVESVGGIFMTRCYAFKSVGGFDASVFSGEEPELCYRLKKNGWKIVRLPEEMAMHDLAMTHFHQWLRRTIRYGYGSLNVATRFGLNRFKKNNLRVWFWTAWLMLTLSMSLYTIIKFSDLPYQLLLINLTIISLWPIQVIRISLRTWLEGYSPKVSFAYGFFTMFSFWPQMIGQLLYLSDRVQNHHSRLLEHKPPSF